MALRLHHACGHELRAFRNKDVAEGSLLRWRGIDGLWGVWAGKVQGAAFPGSPPSWCGNPAVDSQV